MEREENGIIREMQKKGKVYKGIERKDRNKKGNRDTVGEKGIDKDRERRERGQRGYRERREIGKDIYREGRKREERDGKGYIQRERGERERSEGRLRD